MKVFIVCVLASAIGACAPPEQGGSILGVDELSIFAIGPSDILPDTLLEIEGQGFFTEGNGTHTLWVTNSMGLDVLIEAQVIDETHLQVPLGNAFAQVLQTGLDLGLCNLRLTRTSALDGISSWVEVPIALTFVENLLPSISQVKGNSWFPGDAIVVNGDGFLRPEEGELVGHISGTLTSGVRSTSSTFISTKTALEGLSRSTALLHLNPDVFGILPSSFEGSIQIENKTSSENSQLSNELTVGPVSFNSPVLDGVSPQVVRRGQTLKFVGRGFLPTSSIQQASSLILLDGVLTTSRGETISFEGNRVLPLFPDSFEDNTQMNYILRVTQNVDGQLEGLGIVPGSFKGTAYPWILNGKDTVLGQGLNIDLMIAPQLQVVHLKYLPGYFTALERFGLLNAASWVNQQVLQVVHRDYLGINVAFTEDPPADFAEYSTVEIGGEDPNGANLFGLDNTDGKDVGNIRFNDIIGGVNADTAEEGYYAYGGIFVSSFLGLSATLGQGNLPITDVRFDQIFSPFAPELGGKPAQADEIYSGERSAALAEAIRVLGNLIGNTITHEVGHSLGLTSIDGQFHNLGDNEGWIMDAGIHRPFAERAEIDGISPAVFSPFNREYLEAVLPTQ